MEDTRFSHIKTDPKFRRIPKKEKKVKIDKRFQSMFKDDKFKVTYSVDKRGRPVNHKSSEDLRRYYELSSESDSSAEESEQNESEEVGKYVKPPQDDETDLKVKDKSDKGLTDAIKKKLRDLSVDYARGESKLLSDSSSDDEESEDDELSEGEDIDHKWGELDAEADQTETATHRLAACNMDWDRIRAVDLMVLFNSFLPPGGAIKSVCIYPSEFGKARMKEEEIKGPTELVDNNPEETNNDNEEGSKYHMEKLRQYQLNRLKYYYAIITFDNPNSADKVYTECDGMEYESTANILDLRFVPEDMEFDDLPKESCDQLPEVDKYQPRFFTTTALQQAKVDLTWDETDPNRIEFTQKLNTGKLEELSKEDLQNYLASSSEEEEEVEKNNEESLGENSDEEESADVISKYKALLQDIESKDKTSKGKDVEMEISWGINLQEKTDKLIKEKNSDDKTPFQQYLDKKKDKRKEKKKKKKEEQDKNDEDSDIPSDIDINDPYFAEELNKPEFKKSKNKKQNVENNDDNEEKQKELELLLMNNDDNKNHFSLKKIQDNENDSKKKKKWKNKKKDLNNEDKNEDTFSINVNDDRFSALFSSHHFNIDPTDSHFKKTKGMETLVNEKLKRRREDSEENFSATKKNKPEKKKNAELSLLVKNVKRKTVEYMNK